MYIFIINPVAGNGRAMRTFAKIKRSELYHEIESSHFITKYSGHAEEMIEEITKNTLNKNLAIIVIGGDGTLHEVINGLANQHIPISFIPAGSGNDFARGCSIEKSPINVFRKTIQRHEDIPYWLGKFNTNNDTKRLFVNNIGFGFDANIAQVANKSHYKKTLNLLGLGKLIYIIALIQVLRHFKPMDIELEVNGKRKRINGCWMVTIANHPYYGGGMKIIPSATIQPSIFPVLIVHSISKWKILGLFMTVFTGKHIAFKEIEVMETSKLYISSSRSMFYQVDGEAYSCKSCVITKQSQAIRIKGTTQDRDKQIVL